MDKKRKVSESIQNKHTEIHYNVATINTPDGPQRIYLQGKIQCPVLNQKISSIVCYKLMDFPGWPRNVDPCICTQGAQCFVSKSINKHISKKKGKTDGTGKQKPTRTQPKSDR